MCYVCAVCDLRCRGTTQHNTTKLILYLYLYNILYIYNIVRTIFSSPTYVPPLLVITSMLCEWVRVDKRMWLDYYTNCIWMTISDSLIGVIYGMCLFYCGYFVSRVSRHIIFHMPHAFVKRTIERVNGCPQNCFNTNKTTVTLIRVISVFSCGSAMEEWIKKRHRERESSINNFSSNLNWFHLISFDWMQFCWVSMIQKVNDSIKHNSFRCCVYLLFILSCFVKFAE